MERRHFKSEILKIISYAVCGKTVQHSLLNTVYREQSTTLNVVWMTVVHRADELYPRLTERSSKSIVAWPWHQDTQSAPSMPVSELLPVTTLLLAAE